MSGLKYQAVQLNIKVQVKNILKDYLFQIKFFKFQIKFKVTFRKGIENGEIQYLPTIYFIATAVVNDLDFGSSANTSYQIIFSGIQKWLGEGSGLTVKSVNSDCINILIYSKLEGSSNILLPEELRNSRKRLVNIKNKDNKRCLLSHKRHLNLMNKDAQRSLKSDKKWL